MSNKFLFFDLRNLLVCIVIISTLLACASKNTTPTMLPEDMPISKFMIGEWKVISRIDTDNGEVLEINFPIVKIDDKAISYGETFRAEYHFIEEDLIFVNNLRLTSGETWRLERDGEKLIVYQEYTRNTTILDLLLSWRENDNGGVPQEQLPNNACSRQVGTRRVFRHFSRDFGFLPLRRRVSALPPATNASR